MLVGDGDEGEHGKGAGSGLDAPGLLASFLGSKELLGGDGGWRVGNGEEDERAAEQSNGLGMLGVDGFESEFHGQVDFDAVAMLPCAVDRRELARNGGLGNGVAVDGDGGAFSPSRDAEAKGTFGWF